MGERITVKDVRMRFQFFTEAAERAGFDVEYWRLQEGNSTNGIAYRHYTLKMPDGSIGTGHSRTEWDDFLGMTAKEAHHTLFIRQNTLNAVALLRQSVKDALNVEYAAPNVLYQDRDGEAYRAHRYAVRSVAKRLGVGPLSDG